MAVVTTWRGRRMPAKVIEGLNLAADVAEERGMAADARQYREAAHDLADSLDRVPLPACNGDVTVPARPWSPDRLHAAS